MPMNASTDDPGMVRKLSDDELFDRAIGGCRSSLAVLYSRLQRRISPSLKARFGLNDDATDEVVADAWPQLVAWQERMRKAQSELRRSLGIRKAA